MDAMNFANLLNAARDLAPSQKEMLRVQLNNEHATGSPFKAAPSASPFQEQIRESLQIQQTQLNVVRDDAAKAARWREDVLKENSRQTEALEGIALTLGQLLNVYHQRGV